MAIVTLSEYEEFKKSVWLDFLQNANDEEIHMAILTVNYGQIYDLTHPLLSYILNTDTVDKASVLAFYWRLQPQHSKKDWIPIIEQKYENGFYNNQRIFFDPQNDNGENWTFIIDGADFTRETPVIMTKVVGGETVPELFEVSEFEEGLPISYYEKIYEYLNKNEIIG